MKRELDTTLGSTIPDAPSGSDPKLATFDRPAERFELGAELGRGGMGRVVAATDVSLARAVAIKQVLSERPDDLARFEREVRITAQLEHPSIVPIHEANRDDSGRPYYVMRRIEGEPLAKRIQGADLPTRLAMLPNLLAVVDAAAFAHARNIIQRHIKPSNILLGAYGETHLIDWGLARKLDDLDISTPGVRPSGEQLTRVGYIYGTVGYMAPEQARGEPVDQRADVFALGATLFHVLAGTAPFAHMSDAERITAAATGDDRAPLDKLGDGIPPELIAIVDKAMATDPRARYANAGELATDLEGIRQDRPQVDPKQPCTLGRVRRKQRRTIVENCL
jgi:serine/threonine protein kinase